MQEYLTNCVDCGDGSAIHAMVDQAKDVSRRTFKKYVSAESLRQIEEELSYVHDSRQGLTMANDWHVSYHRSVFRKHPCSYFVHSAIEYIFIERISP